MVSCGCKAGGSGGSVADGGGDVGGSDGTGCGGDNGTASTVLPSAEVGGNVTPDWSVVFTSADAEEPGPAVAAPTETWGTMAMLAELGCSGATSSAPSPQPTRPAGLPVQGGEAGAGGVSSGLFAGARGSADGVPSRGEAGGLGEEDKAGVFLWKRDTTGARRERWRSGIRQGGVPAPAVVCANALLGVVARKSEAAVKAAGVEPSGGDGGNARLLGVHASHSELPCEEVRDSGVHGVPIPPPTPPLLEPSCSNSGDGDDSQHCCTRRKRVPPSAAAAAAATQGTGAGLGEDGAGVGDEGVARTHGPLSSALLDAAF